MRPLHNDIHCTPAPFDDNKFEEIYQKSNKLKFGYFINNGLVGKDSNSSVDCSKPVRRAMEKTIDTLKKEGHECEEIDIKIFDGFMQTNAELLLSMNLVSYKSLNYRIFLHLGQKVQSMILLRSCKHMQYLSSSEQQWLKSSR